ncbi:hypothetical protein IFR05_012102 [Cadophora sp. M221]|nr:hypothetical protein IFR05_012102 [Cadophora sp. M221]
MAVITNKEWDDVKVLLVTLCYLADESTTVGMIQKFHIMGVLAMFIQTNNGLPHPIPDVAKVMKDKFQTIIDGHLAISSTEQLSAKSSKSTRPPKVAPIQLQLSP